MEEFQARVMRVEIKERRVRVEGPDGQPFYELKQVGNLHLEFDAAAVDVRVIAELVGREGTRLGLSDTQLGLELGNLDPEPKRNHTWRGAKVCRRCGERKR